MVKKLANAVFYYLFIREGGALYINTDGINFSKNSKINSEVTSLTISQEDIIYAGAFEFYGKGNLYARTGGINFAVVKGVNNSVFS